MSYLLFSYFHGGNFLSWKAKHVIEIVHCSIQTWVREWPSSGSLVILMATVLRNAEGRDVYKIFSEATGGCLGVHSTVIVRTLFMRIFAEKIFNVRTVHKYYTSSV